MSSKDDNSELDADVSENDSNEELVSECDDDGSDVDQQELAKIRDSLSDMSFEDLEKLKEKLGLKVFNEFYHGKKLQKKKQQFKRANKNRPMEQSSKKYVPLVRKENHIKKSAVRDPRFDDLSGQLDEKIFSQTFSFLKDVKKRDREKVLKKLKREKNPEIKEKLKYLTKRMDQQDKIEKEKSSKQAREQMLSKKEKQLVSEGKRPFYLKKSERKKLDLAEKYKELKKSGKLEKYMAKKRKKNASKERRKLPS